MLGSMSTTSVTDPHLVSEVAALKALIGRLLQFVESDADGSKTIPQFCASERISRAFLRAKKLGQRAAGDAPRGRLH